MSERDLQETLRVCIWRELRNFRSIGFDDGERERGERSDAGEERREETTEMRV